MKIEGSTALVTGSNRGLGKVFVDLLIERGAKKVYATAPDLASVLPLVEAHGERVVALQLDVTKPEDIAQVVKAAGDVTLLVNNAGVAEVKGVFEAGNIEGLRYEMDVNTFGLARMCLAFAPEIEKNGGGTILNVLSLSAVFAFPFLGSYGASKAASASLTQSMRYELADRGVHVCAMYAGFIDTDMTKDLVVETVAPDVVANAALDGVEAELDDIDTHDECVQIRMGLRLDPDNTNQAMAEYSRQFRVENPLE